MVLYGGASGNPDPFDPMLLARGSYTLTFASHVPYTGDPALYPKMASEMLQLVSENKLEFGTVEKIPLANAHEAQDKLEFRKAAGKILLVP